jgi:hypothetical protein
MASLTDCPRIDDVKVGGDECAGIARCYGEIEQDRRTLWAVQQAVSAFGHAATGIGCD